MGWLYDFYVAQLEKVAQPKPSRFLVILAETLRGITLAYIYPLGYRGGKYWSEGMRYGLLMGFFTGLVIAIIYAQVKIKSIAWLFTEFSFVLIQGAIVGVVIAYTYGDKAKD
ncbi:MAG: hypothetical protein HY423_08055 [Candidatus Lambdaproteobacteria bacterium]|nr:hypothetical protein [Candidatus Lambdaproteobacteria bacterium]